MTSLTNPTPRTLFAGFRVPSTRSLREQKAIYIQFRMVLSWRPRLRLSNAKKFFLLLSSRSLRARCCCGQPRFPTANNCGIILAYFLSSPIENRRLQELYKQRSRTRSFTRNEKKTSFVSFFLLLASAVPAITAAREEKKGKRGEMACFEFIQLADGCLMDLAFSTSWLNVVLFVANVVALDSELLFGHVQTIWASIRRLIKILRVYFCQK